jgi:uncharacterized membrane protein (UPF0127 family)
MSIAIATTLKGRAMQCMALFVMLVVLAIAGGQDQAIAKMREDRLTLVTSSGEHIVNIEIADTEQDKALGLMFRTSLPQNRGMLFPYRDPHEVTMWMKNTYISLDMVFIRADGVVHRIEAYTEPRSETIIPSNGPVVAVLELIGGEAARLGLKPGDQVVYPTFKRAKR